MSQSSTSVPPTRPLSTWPLMVVGFGIAVTLGWAALLIWLLVVAVMRFV